MQKGSGFLRALIMPQNRMTIPRRLLVLGPLLFLLPVILWLILQFNRQLVDQQQVLDNRVMQTMIRHIAQLQRAHLRVYVSIGQADNTFDEAQARQQLDLVWNELTILESPLYHDNWPLAAQALLHDYRTKWEGVQPALARWQSTPSDPTIQTDLLQAMEVAEKDIINLSLVAQDQFQAQLVAWGQSTQRLNFFVTGAILIFILLILSTIYLLYQFLRTQTYMSHILRSSEQRLRAILDTIPDAVFRVTRTGTFVDVKPPRNFELVAEIESVIGKSLNDLLPPAIATATSQAIEQALTTDTEQLYEYQLLDEKSGMRDFEARILPSGKDEVQIIVRDVTVEKRQEELTRRSQKLESLGVLAGGIAHDFNNLLTGMLGQNSLAKLKLGKGLPAIEHIDKAILSAERAADLTKQLLAYAGKGKFQIEPLNLNQLINDTLALMQAALPDYARFTVDLHEPLPLFAADRGQIQQIVMNLFINAIEALHPDEGTIHITTRIQTQGERRPATDYIVNHLPDGPCVLLQVADNGVGMEQATLNRIFDPFFSTKPTGHGLGLSATIGILRTHEGGLHVQSQPGQGTTFTLLFPVVPTSSTAPLAPLAPLLPTAQQKTILVIDDEAEIRQLAYDILVTHGHRVLLAQSGPQGIDQFQQAQAEISLVLLDVKMPGMNGKQTYQALRQIDPTVKVIFASGYSETELNTELGGPQTVTFLPKPYSAEQLSRAVQMAA